MLAINNAFYMIIEKRNSIRSRCAVVTIKNEEDIVTAIKQDKWMMNLLKAVKTLDLPDWWICAGFVRSKIWDVNHNYSARTPLSDIDVIYFDSANVDKLEEKKIEADLKTLVSHIPWSVKNQNAHKK